MLTLRDLTSFPIKAIELSHSEDDWHYLREKVENPDIDVLVGLKTGKKKYQILKNGLVHGVIYSVESLHNLNDDEGHPLRLVLLQSTVPEGRWNGDFGQFSKKWSKRLRREVSHIDTSNGQFFMEFDDFREQFTQVIYFLSIALFGKILKSFDDILEAK